MTDDNSYTTEARDSKFDQPDKEGSIQTASDESGDTDVYGKVTRSVADQLGEFFSVTVTDDEDAVRANLVGDTKNFGKFETPNRAAYGVGISRSILEDLTGEELPESIGLTFAPSSEEAYEEALEELDESTEEEAEALIAGGDSDEGDEEEEVEVSDEELNLVDAE